MKTNAVFLIYFLTPLKCTRFVSFLLTQMNFAKRSTQFYFYMQTPWVQPAVLCLVSLVSSHSLKNTSNINYNFDKVS